VKSDEKVILLVEDNEDDELLTVRALRQNRVRNSLVIARDGAEALEYLFGEGKYAGRDPLDTPQLIFLDLNLPKVGGLDVLRRIRADARLEFVPVIILTTSKEEQDMIQGYRNRANSYIRKPVNFNEFTEAVSQMGMYWLLLNEVPRNPAGTGK